MGGHCHALPCCHVVACLCLLHIIVSIVKKNLGLLSCHVFTLVAGDRCCGWWWMGDIVMKEKT